MKDDLVALFLLTIAAAIGATRGSTALADAVQAARTAAMSAWEQRPSWKQIARHPSLYLAAVVTVTMLVGWWQTALAR